MGKGQNGLPALAFSEVQCCSLPNGRCVPLLSPHMWMYQIKDLCTLLPVNNACWATEAGAWVRLPLKWALWRQRWACHRKPAAIHVCLYPVRVGSFFFFFLLLNHFILSNKQYFIISSSSSNVFCCFLFYIQSFILL